MRGVALLLLTALAVSGCGATEATKGLHPPPPSRSPAHGRRGGAIPSSLLSGVRPIGPGPRFQPPLRGHLTGACTAPLGRRRQAHIELFGANRVVLLATGIGSRAPRQVRDGRLTRARCFGPVVTLDPTGTVYFRTGRRLTLGNLFNAWGQALTPTQIGSFTGGRVRVYINGRASALSPRAVPLTQDAEIVLEVGRRVPPHTRFSFPSPPSPALR